MEANELLQNKLFLQYLAGTGAALGSGESPAAAMGAVTNQNIQNQNFMKLLKQLLGPDGTKGTFDSSGLTLKLPKESALFGSFLGGDTGEPLLKAKSMEEITNPATNLSSVPQGSNLGGLYGSGLGGPNIANPFVESSSGESLKPSDLAGLTSQDIVAAIGAKHAQDQLRQQSFRDIVDAIYKGKKITMEEEAHPVDINYKKAQTKLAQSSAEENTPSIDVDLGGGVKTKLTQKDYIAWKKMEKETTPAEIKLYEFARKQGFTGSIIDFKNSDKTGHMKDYEKAKADGYDKDFNTWMLDMAKAGAINLGDKLNEKAKMGELQGQIFFNNPKWSEDVEKDTAKYVTDTLWSADPTTRTKEATKYKVKLIEGKIAAGGGTIQNARWAEDGKTMIWTVKWPSGNTQEVKYGLR